MRSMEHSVNSSMGKAVSANNNMACPDEESGWTSYLEDFSKDMVEPSHCSSLGGSSLLSDAASCPAWKFSHQNHAVSCSSAKDAPNPPKKLSFKKTRTKQVSEDDPLEDTASSPVNSPKVGDLNPTETIPRKTDDQLDGSMGKGFTSEHYSDLQAERAHEFGYNGKNLDCRDLKKRGLCLVPLSMLVDYLGD